MFYYFLYDFIKFRKIFLPMYTFIRNSRVSRNLGNGFGKYFSLCVTGERVMDHPHIPIYACTFHFHFPFSGENKSDVRLGRILRWILGLGPDFFSTFTCLSLFFHLPWLLKLYKGLYQVNKILPGLQSNNKSGSSLLSIMK